MARMVGKFRQARVNYASKLGRPVSVQEVATAIGVSRQFLSNMEHDKVKPSWETLEKMCQLYGIKPGDLLDMEELAALIGAGSGQLHPYQG